MGVLRTAGKLARIGFGTAAAIDRVGEKGLDATVKGVTKVTKAVASASKKVPIPKPVAERVKAGSDFVAGKAQIKKPFVDVVDKEGNVKKSLGNLYTGKRMNSLYVAGGGAAFLAINNSKHGLETKMAPLELATKNDFQYLGSPDILMYDGVGQKPNTPKNLNASGDVVFGLHNSRRG